MASIRCVWKFWPYPDCATVNLDRRLPKIGGHLFRGLLDLTPPDERDDRFVGDLEAIDGVAKVSMIGYEMFVTKGLVFVWDEIRPLVNAVIAGYFGAEIEAMPDERHVGVARETLP